MHGPARPWAMPTRGVRAQPAMSRRAAPTSTCSDEELAARFAEGDVEAYAALAERYLRPLFNFAYRFLGSYDDAQDATQAALITLHRTLPRARLDHPLRPWIYQIARTRCLDLLRQRRTTTFSELEGEDDPGDSPLAALEDDDPLPAEWAERAELQRALHDAIQALPPNYRTVVVLRYTTDLTFAEIGASLGIPENSAKTLFQRAKPLLRRALRSALE